MKLPTAPLMTLAAACILVMIIPGRDSSAADRSDGGFSEKYSSLWQKNMFVRDRRRISSSTGPSTEPSTRMEPTYVLRGVVLAEQQDDLHTPTYVAFVEDVRNGTPPTQVKVGEAAARGRLTAIDINGVEYESGGQSRRVEIGGMLEGTSVASVASAATQPSGDSTTSGGGAMSDIEARMRARRLQETGGK